MNEDPELNRFVARTLEAGEPFRFVAPPIHRRLPWRWLAPTLLAASLAAVAALHAVWLPVPDTIAPTIALLLESDGLPPDDLAEKNSAELLLAWQDAPCADFL